MTSQRTRDRLVARLHRKGVRDKRVLQAIAQVPRHLFVDEAMASRSYEDMALPIGNGQTISQPYIVALMSAALLASSRPLRRVLEVGTGSGYQTAVLSCLVAEVFSVERVRALYDQALLRLAGLGYRNVHGRYADGGWGWPEEAPFDAIIVTAAAQEVPEVLLQQLADGGRMVIPVAQKDGTQQLLLIERELGVVRQQVLEQVLFVPLLAGSC